MLRPEIFFYRDANGKLKKTRTGHYRFDIKLTREDGRAYMTITGFRYDYAQKRILSPTLMTGRGNFTIAEVSPGEHDNLAAQLHKLINSGLEEERIAVSGGY